MTTVNSMEKTTNKKPLISVIMGLYNCEKTLDDALASIFSQTEKEWELVMCDDGSTDGTYEKAKGYFEQFPDRIVLLKNERNMGLNHTLNKCLKASNGLYIARMDGDDLCKENRFELELEVFRSEPDVSIVSCDMEYFDENGIWGRICHPDYPDKKDFLKGSPFCHAPCMVRRSAFDAVNGYSEEKRLLRVEDYHLWMKMYRLGLKGKNIHEALYQMRDDRNAYNRRKFKYRLNEAYVRGLCVKELKLPVYGYIYALRPVLIGFLPKGMYDYLHRRNLRKKDDLQ